jgi:hypothetical protein
MGTGRSKCFRRGSSTEFLTRGTTARTAIPCPLDFHPLVGRQSKGPKIRHRQWRLADYDGDGTPDLVFGIEDWSEYGWDDAWDVSGRWTAGPLHGFVYWARNRAQWKVRGTPCR